MKIDPKSSKRPTSGKNVDVGKTWTSEKKADVGTPGNAPATLPDAATAASEATERSCNAPRRCTCCFEATERPVDLIDFSPGKFRGGGAGVQDCHPSLEQMCRKKTNLHISKNELATTASKRRETHGATQHRIFTTARPKSWKMPKGKTQPTTATTATTHTHTYRRIKPRLRRQRRQRWQTTATFTTLVSIPARGIYGIVL